MTPFQLSTLFCRHNKVCILKQTDQSVTVGMTDVDDEVLQEKIRKAFYLDSTNRDRTIQFAPVDPVQCQRMIERCENPRQAGTESGTVTDEADFESSPAVSLINGVILESLEQQASDIHFEIGETVRIRLRIDGELVPYRDIEQDLYQRVVVRLKVLAGLQTENTRQAQDGRFLWSSAGLNCDVRISCIPVWNGESIVLRLLHTRGVPLRPEKLGFSDTHLSQLSSLCNLNSSLILVCGPTGSGKTTTLASLLSEVSRGNRKIITIEDPVEYRLPFVTQIETSRGSLDFSEALTRVFRHDPDVLMIGEIRDEETARIAVRAALTGHLVFATVHTTNAATAVLRILDMGIEPYLLSSVFGAAVAQRLVKKPGGGRTVTAEVLLGTPAIREVIYRRGTQMELETAMQRGGMVTMQHDYEQKKLKGVCL